MTEPGPPGAEDTPEIRRSPAPAPGPAAAAAHNLAASHARRSAEAMDAVLRLTEVVDEQTRELAHEAFLKAFPIAYRLWRTNAARNQPDRPPEWPPTRQG